MTSNTNVKRAEIRTRVFNETCNFVRRRGGLPPFGQLLRYSQSVAKQLAGNTMSLDEATAVGTEAAKYVAANNDSALARPAPVRPGRIRAAEAERILVLHRRSIAEGKPLSVRQLAEALSVSRTKVHNTLQAAGFNPKRQTKIVSLSRVARTIVKIIDRISSFDGKRAIELSVLVSAVEAWSGDEDIEAIKSAIREVDEAGINIRILITEIVHPNSGSLLVALSRGRRPDDLQLVEWVKDKIREQAEKKRLGLPKRVLLEISGKILHYPMARDLSSVLKIRAGNRNLDTWRDFITASSGGGEPARETLQIVAFDIPKIVSAAASFVRLSDADPVKILGRMHDWVAEKMDQGTAAHVFAIASQLIESSMSDAEALEWWAEQSQYLKRVKFLGDRDPLEFTEIICQDNDDEDESIWRAIVRLDEYHVPPDRLIKIRRGADRNLSGDIEIAGKISTWHQEIEVDHDAHGSDWDLEGFILDADHDEPDTRNFSRDEPVVSDQEAFLLAPDEEIPI